MVTEPRHGGGTEASGWVRRFAHLVPSGGRVLDLAAGRGRHARLFLGRGHPVVAVDRDAAALRALDAGSALEIIEADLEGGGAWPIGRRRFAGVVVTNYLWRPLLGRLVAGVETGGVLIYETFAQGNERLSRPANPDFLVRPGELLDAVRGALTVVAYEHGVVTRPRPAVVQRIVARRDPKAASPPDLEGADEPAAPH